MAYVTPRIDGNGITIPTYLDLVENIVEYAKTLYGSDIYLENDSADYQFISAFCSKANDLLQLAQSVYNNMSPSTARGAALDLNIQLNGMTRKVPTYSTVQLVVSGTYGTVINNGIAKDIHGIKWDLPSEVIIPVSGEITVTAVCETIGAINALTGEINQIETPTYGWVSVINNAGASLGQPVETEEQVKGRQALSTAAPSQSLLEGTRGAIADLSGVTRSRVYENDTNAPETDPNGFNLPAHSITCVVEGGIDTEIANAISVHKGGGCYTNGDYTVNLTGRFGDAIPIRYYTPTYADIDVEIGLLALSGYTSDIVDTIKDLLVEYLNSLRIGENLVWSVLYAVVLGAMPDLKNPCFAVTSLQIGEHGSTGGVGTSDIVIDFNKVTRGNANYITVNVSGTT